MGTASQFEKRSGRSASGVGIGAGTGSSYTLMCVSVTLMVTEAELVPAPPFVPVLLSVELITHFPSPPKHSRGSNLLSN